MRYEIETGVYYHWRIASDGLEEYKVLADELEPVSEWTVTLPLMPRKDRATQQEWRHG